MYVEVDLRGEPPELSLREPEDFRSFKLVTLGSASAARGSENALDAALAPLGTRTGTDHAYLRPDAVAALAGSLAAERAWRASFDAMVSFAASQGWCDEDGRVRAHIEHA